MNKHIQIELPNRTNCEGWGVTIDGRELGGVTDVRMDRPLVDTPHVTIELAAETVTIEQETGGVKLASE